MDSARNRSTTVCIGLLVAVLTRPGWAQQGDEAEDAVASEGPRACLAQPAIQRTKILNNRNIVFVTRHDEIYNNELPKQCQTLNRRSLINYRIANGRVCAGDRFQVLLEPAPKNFVPGPLCELGAFVPITESELEDLMAMTAPNRERSSRGRSKREAVTSEQVELPPPATTPTASEPSAAQ